MYWTTTVKIVLISAFIWAGAVSQAQVFMPSMEEFGKNRIQRQRYEWQIITSSNFEIYFHGNSRALATYTIQLAELEFDRITEILSYTPYSRTKIFLYDTPDDFKQSNIGITLNSAAEIREENLSKSRVQIAFTANHVQFRRQLVKEISSVFVYDMLYGGSLKDALQSQLLLSLPDWFIAGITSYVAEGWSLEMDDYMRDVALNKKFKKPSQLTGDEAARIGQSIWNFIAERYGRDNISNILNLTRIIRTEQTSISSTLGVSFSRFLSDWRDYYTQLATMTASSYKALPGSKLATYPLLGTQKVTQVKLSPNQQYITYTVTDEGQYRVYLYNFKSQRHSQLLKGGDRFLTRELPVLAPLLAWQPNGNLNVLIQQDDSKSLWQYVPNEKTSSFKLKSKRNIRGFNQIASFDISNDGSTLALSADRKGQSDLFLYNINRGSTQQLTNDLYDDLTPAFIGRSTNHVVFSSNRITDTLSTAAPKYLLDRYRLFVHEGNARAQTVQHVSDLANAWQPLSTNDEQLYFLGNDKGIWNLYAYDSTASKPLTQFRESIVSYDYNPSSKALVYVSIENGEQVIGYVPRLNVEEVTENVMTARAVRLSGGTVRVANEPVKGGDSTQPAGATVTQAKPSRLGNLKPGEIDTDNYTFDLEGIHTMERRNMNSSAPKVITNSRSNRTIVRKDASHLKGPTPYKDRFVINNTDNRFLVAPYLPTQSDGFGWLNTIQLNDLLENNIIKGGLFITPTFRTSEIFGEYKYLARRFDFGVRIDRNAFTDGVPASGLYQKYRYYRLTLTASYPINEALRVSISPMLTRTHRIDGDQGNLGLATNESTYGGVSGEVVFDNTRNLGPNLLEGTRIKLKAQQQQGISRSSDSYYKINLDARHYTKIYRNLILATRLSAGNSGGSSPKASVLGGIDNWLPFGTVREERSTENPLSSSALDYRDRFLTDFVTPLRGFKMNKLSGDSYMLFNAELRWPLFKFLSQGPLTSNFLRNFQLVAFTDIGTAWTGSGPFSRQNSLNTTIVSPGGGSPWYATVTNFKNPYLIGYGAGIRTLFLGYYVKGDLAWGIEDKTVQTPILHISLGYDF
ncbi:MAG: hypothetical protein QM669_09495 [Siphonobacter sp.]